jgi:hypothetical protein
MPLRRRPYDIVLLIFITINLVLVTYLISIEQLTIPDSSNFEYPAWPPPAVVDIIHNYGSTYDPLQMARPAFWKMTIWIDVVLFGPFYAAAIYALIRRRNWIRTPALIWSGMMLANVLIILMEERFGVWAAPNWNFMIALNLPWLLLPLAMMWRMRKDPFPAEKEASVKEKDAKGAHPDPEHIVLTSSQPAESSTPA